MPRKKAPQATVDQLLDRQPESRATAPVCDYLLHAANSDTTSKSIISVKNFRQGLSQMIPLNHLFPIDDLTKPENQMLLRERVAANLTQMDYQGIEMLLDETDPRYLKPPNEELNKPKAARADWNRIDPENTCLVSQRLLKSYQIKRQLLRNDQHERETNYRNSLKTEYLGYRRFSPYALRIEHETLEKNMKAIAEKKLTIDNRELDNDSVVLTVAVFLPKSKGNQTRQACEFKVHHKTRLVDLIDRFICPNDQISMVKGEEFAMNPERDPRPLACEKFPDKFIFIHDTFYYDNRNDYSLKVASRVKEFLDHRSVSIPKPTKLVPMLADPENGFPEDVLIDHLEFNMGLPYLYQHVHDCEHLVVFMDMKAISMSDPQTLAEYPIMMNKPTPRRVLCRVCEMHSAVWETRKDEEADYDPCYWCQKCFRSFHYTKDMKMAHSFLARPFTDPAILYGNMQ